MTVYEIEEEDMIDTRKARNLKRTALFLILINMYILIFDFIPLKYGSKIDPKNVLQFLGFKIGEDVTVAFSDDDNGGATRLLPGNDRRDFDANKYQIGGNDMLESIKKNVKANTLKNILHFVLAVAALGCMGEAARLENPGLEYDYLITPIFWALFISLGLNLIYKPKSDDFGWYQGSSYRIIMLIVFFALSVALTAVANNNLSAQDEEQDRLTSQST